MGEDNRICGKRERRIPRFLADFQIDEKLTKNTKNTRPKALRKTTTAHRKFQSRPLSPITRLSELSTFCMRATLKKRVIIDNVNTGNKEYDSEETETASEGQDDSESWESTDQGSETESDFEKEFYDSYHDLRAEVALPTLSHRDMCRPTYEDPDYQRLLVVSYRHGWLSTERNKNAQPLTTAVSHSGYNSHSPKQVQLAVTSSPRRPGRPACRKMYGVAQCKRKKKNESKSSLKKNEPAPGHKKCRKVYGPDQSELWCTQCKWKKACTRFEEDDI